MMSLFVYNIYKSCSVNFPNTFCRSGWTLMNSFAMFTIDKESRASLFSFRMVKELNLIWLIVERSQVFNRRMDENDLSGVAHVAPIVKTNLMIMTTFSIILSRPFNKDLTTSTISLKFTGLFPSNMTGSNSNSMGKDSLLKSPANF